MIEKGCISYLDTDTSKLPVRRILDSSFHKTCQETFFVSGASKTTKYLKISFLSCQKTINFYFIVKKQKNKITEKKEINLDKEIIPSYLVPFADIEEYLYEGTEESIRKAIKVCQFLGESYSTYFYYLLDHAATIRRLKFKEYSIFFKSDFLKKPNSKLNSSIFFNYLCKKGVVDQSYFESEDIFDDRPIEEIENVYRNDTIESFAIHDDIENFKSLFSEDKYTTHDLKEGYTLTSLAALYGAKEVFKFLVYQREHEISEDLAIYATKGGDFDIISICQQNNLDFSNCLKYAIEYNRMNVAKWIIECFGVNFEAGIAASVIYFNTPFLAFFLLNYFGVNEFYNNTTPLMFAAKVGNLEMVKFIKEHDAVMDLRDDFNRTALHIAILENNVVIAKYLVDNGSNINMIEKSSISPLMCAVRAQSIEIASFLLQKGCDVNEQDCTEMTSLLYACETGNLAIIKLLVEHKSDIMMCNIFGCYPIHIAAMNGHVDAIKYLIEIGQRIDVKDKEGRTPIFYSVENNFYEVTEYLISEGSHTNLKNNKGKKLISFAKSDEMKQLLMKHMSSRTCYIY